MYENGYNLLYVYKLLLTFNLLIFITQLCIVFNNEWLEVFELMNREFMLIKFKPE
jgi:hypothetical protein